MSTDRVKGYHPKLDNGDYGPFMPFGSDGILIDMLSGLNLEYEMILGGKRRTEITESSNSIQITTIFYNMNSEQTYKIIIQIPNSVITSTSGSIGNITAQLYDSSNTLLKTRTLTYNAATNVTTETIS